ncbi:MAG: hypothetical protein KF773_22180 [Deltaproteobacteria bacterium]|nr:hypothetical protein [Deltaproteobacteria bacterium]MCW5804168.1 hypothetical protein [Deltaproteobacteria bacterium]
MSARHIELEGRLSIADVPDVRRFVENVHHRFVGSDDLSRVAMTAHELLENAVKFSADGAARLRIELADGEIRIITRNRAHPGDVEVLSAFARRLEAAPSAMNLYLDLMRSPTPTVGGLGLGRIAAEGEMALDLALDGDWVQVTAHTVLSAA